jgi:hypothetical protein
LKGNLDFSVIPCNLIPDTIGSISGLGTLLGKPQDKWGCVVISGKMKIEKAREIVTEMFTALSEHIRDAMEVELAPPEGVKGTKITKMVFSKTG